MSTASYFDFHFHPAFKQFITVFDEPRSSQRKAAEIRQEMDLRNAVLDFLDENMLHILESQCSYNQLHRGGVKLGIANIIAIEHGIADGRNLIGKVLRSDLTRPMDPALLQSIRKGQTSYYSLFKKELEMYRILSDVNDGALVELLTRKAPVQFDQNKFYLAIGMEGGHNLSRYFIAQPGNPEFKGDAVKDHRDVVSSFHALFHELWNRNMDLFYITLTHMSFIPEQHLANHAYGMKLLKHPAFMPIRSGLHEDGKKLVSAAYDMQMHGVQTPVLIDIKHMSLKSRLDFYAYRNSNGYADIPIIATHMGVTGYSIAEWTAALEEHGLVKQDGLQGVSVVTERKPAGEWGKLLNKEFTFNPWSINLMDEDIIEILRSGGLIGMSLDVRILGYEPMIKLKKAEAEELFSVAEFRHFFPHLPLPPSAAEPEPLTESELIPTKKERHPICLCLNIIHILSVAAWNKDIIGNNMQDAWDHICIGSDFDGLIDPVKICRDASQMPALEQNIFRWLPVAETAYRKVNEGPLVLPRVNKDTIDLAALRQCVQKIMFGNGKRLVENWLLGKLR